jgi:class 3 adenylate cyclase/tetratricopeptide (TPR) repeat protein
VNAHIKIVEEMLDEMNPESLFHARQALALARRIGYARGIAWGLVYVPDTEAAEGRFDKALPDLKESMRLFDSLGDTRGMGKVHQVTGFTFLMQQQYSLSEERLLYALKIFEDLKDTFNIEETSILLGAVSNATGNRDKALEYLQQALEAAKAVHTRAIPNIMSRMASVYTGQKQYDKARDYGQQALALAQKNRSVFVMQLALLFLGRMYEATSNFPQAEAQYRYALRLIDSSGVINTLSLSIFQALTQLYVKQERYDEAFRLCQQVIALARTFDDTRALAGSLADIGGLYLLHGKTHEAIDSYRQALPLAEKNGQLQQLRTVANKLSEAFEQEKNYAKALEYHKLGKTYSDSILRQDRTRQVANLEANYRLEKQKLETNTFRAEAAAERADAERQRWVTIAVGAALALAVALGVVLFRSNRAKDRATKEILHQQHVLEEQAVEIELANTALHVAHERSEELLLNVLPSAIADRLKSGERTIADKFDSVTVLFADVVGFTKLSASTTPEGLVSLLDALFSGFDELAERYGLEKIKTIGDAYMVVGGLPVLAEDHAERVARFALAMQPLVNEMADKFGMPGLAMRIGLHTGEVVAGVIGKKKFAYDLWGDTVNTASRMESRGEAGKIQVSPEVYELLREKFVFEERGEIEVKGKGKMRTWFLVRAA